MTKITKSILSEEELDKLVKDSYGFYMKHLAVNHAKLVSTNQVLYRLVLTQDTASESNSGSIGIDLCIRSKRPEAYEKSYRIVKFDNVSDAKKVFCHYAKARELHIDDSHSSDWITNWTNL